MSRLRSDQFFLSGHRDAHSLNRRVAIPAVEETEGPSRVEDSGRHKQFEPDHGSRAHGTCQCLGVPGFLPCAGRVRSPAQAMCLVLRAVKAQTPLNFLAFCFVEADRRLALRALFSWEY